MRGVGGDQLTEGALGLVVLVRLLAGRRQAEEHLVIVGQTTARVLHHADGLLVLLEIDQRRGQRARHLHVGTRCQIGVGRLRHPGFERRDDALGVAAGIPHGGQRQRAARIRRVDRPDPTRGVFGRLVVTRPLFDLRQQIPGTHVVRLVAHDGPQNRPALFQVAAVGERGAIAEPVRRVVGIVGEHLRPGGGGPGPVPLLLEPAGIANAALRRRRRAAADLVDERLGLVRLARVAVGLHEQHDGLRIPRPIQQEVAQHPDRVLRLPGAQVQLAERELHQRITHAVDLGALQMIDGAGDDPIGVLRARPGNGLGIDQPQARDDTSGCRARARAPAPPPSGLRPVRPAGRERWRSPRESPPSPADSSRPRDTSRSPPPDRCCRRARAPARTADRPRRSGRSKPVSRAWPALPAEVPRPDRSAA